MKKKAELADACLEAIEVLESRARRHHCMGTDCSECGGWQARQILRDALEIEDEEEVEQT